MCACALSVCVCVFGVLFSPYFFNREKEKHLTASDKEKERLHLDEKSERSDSGGAKDLAVPKPKREESITTITPPLSPALRVVSSDASGGHATPPPTTYAEAPASLANSKSYSTSGDASAPQNVLLVVGNTAHKDRVLESGTVVSIQSVCCTWRLSIIICFVKCECLLIACLLIRNDSFVTFSLSISIWRADYYLFRYQPSPFLLLLSHPTHSVRSPIIGMTLFSWTAYIREPQPGAIGWVEFKLHPSFTPDYVQRRTPPFEVTRVGWGVFPVKVPHTHAHTLSRAYPHTHNHA